MSFLGAMFGTPGSGGSSGNINTVFDATQAQQVTAPAMNAQQNAAIANQQQLYGQQQGYAGQLQATAQGQGPSVAGQFLQNANQQQQAAAAAQAAGARGVNPALAQRSAMEASAQGMQGNAAQAAMMKNQEALQAQGQLGNLYSNMSQQQMGQQQLGGQQQALQQQANLANQTANLQAAQISKQSAEKGFQAQAGLFNGIMSQFNPLGSMAEGGMVKMADGGDPFFAAGKATGRSTGLGLDKILDTGLQAAPQIAGMAGKAMAMADGGPVSKVGQHFKSVSEGKKVKMADGGDPFFAAGKATGRSTGLGLDKILDSGLQALPDLAKSMGGGGGGGMPMAQGGEVPALVSPGERYLPPAEVKEVAKGKKSPLRAGQKIPGKPKYKGNDYRNDTVPKTLEAGGIVIPNKVLQSKDPAKQAAKFVAATLAKQSLKKGK